MKKILRMGSILTFLFGFVLLAPLASADSSHNVPKLYSIIEKTSTSMVLPVKDTKFRNKTTTAIVSIKKKNPKMISEKIFNVSFDQHGKSSIKVTGLRPGTKYTFKVRLMKIGSEKTTPNSSSKTAKTL